VSELSERLIIGLPICVLVCGAHWLVTHGILAFSKAVSYEAAAVIGLAVVGGMILLLVRWLADH